MSNKSTLVEGIKGELDRFIYRFLGPRHIKENQTAEQKLDIVKAAVETQFKEYHRMRDNILKSSERALLWQGKWALLKHENNKLRKKLHKQVHKDTPKWTKEQIEEYRKTHVLPD